MFATESAVEIVNSSMSNISGFVYAPVTPVRLKLVDFYRTVQKPEEAKRVAAENKEKFDAAGATTARAPTIRSVSTGLPPRCMPGSSGEAGRLTASN